MPRTTTTAGALLLSGVLLLAGCGGSSTEAADHSPEKRANATTAPPAKPVADPVVAPLAPGSVDAKLASVDVSSAYDFAVAIAKSWSFRPGLLPVDDQRTAAAWAAAPSYMTPELGQKFTGFLPGALASESEALAGRHSDANTLAGFSFYNATRWIQSYEGAGDWRPTGKDAVLVHHTITKPKVELTSNGAVRVTFIESGDFAGTLTGKPTLARVTKTIGYVLMRGSEGSWLLDGWNVSDSGLTLVPGGPTAG